MVSPVRWQHGVHRNVRYERQCLGDSPVVGGRPADRTTGVDLALSGGQCGPGFSRSAATANPVGPVQSLTDPRPNARAGRATCGLGVRVGHGHTSHFDPVRPDERRFQFVSDHATERLKREVIGKSRPPSEAGDGSGLLPGQLAKTGFRYGREVRRVSRRPGTSPVSVTSEVLNVECRRLR